jgi:hypothetical protein
MPGNPRVYDADAQVYIANVEAADGRPLEREVCVAINDFVVGCKVDEIWSSLRAAVILLGARSLRGALVPLVGPSPVNYNFVTGDYNRTTGLVGGGSKRIDTRLAHRSLPQNNMHYSVWIHTRSPSIPTVYMGNGNSTTEVGASNFGQETLTGMFVRHQNGTNITQLNTGLAVGFFGCSRSLAAGYRVRVNGLNRVNSLVSQVPYNDNFYVYASTVGGNNASSPRLSFYSAGLDVDLVKLDGRLTQMIRSISQWAVAR